MSQKGYTIYGIDTASEHGGYFATLAEAKKAARAACKQSGWNTTVEKYEVVPITKASLLEILNTSGGSWCRSTEDIITYKGKDE
jgi:arsenate reductase-like glutaredoxin family protein